MFGELLGVLELASTGVVARQVLCRIDEAQQDGALFVLYVVVVVIELVVRVDLLALRVDPFEIGEERRLLTGARTGQQMPFAFRQVHLWHSRRDLQSGRGSGLAAGRLSILEGANENDEQEANR